MSRQGSTVAQQHGDTLPTFSCQADAEQYYYAFRDKHLARLSEIASHHLAFLPDYRPESLKQLEQWYFQLYETDGFHALGINRETFEACMAMYFGETAARSANAHWIVARYFLAANAYELIVQRGSFSMALFCFTDHFRTPNNKKRECLFRRYEKYFGHSQRL